MSMEPQTSHFQFVTHDPSQSQRQRELSVSRARAHAARVSFRPWYGHETRLTIEAADKTQSPDPRPLRERDNGKSGSLPPHLESCPNNKDVGRGGDLHLVHAANHHTYDPWQVSFGYRVDPFRCLPGSDERIILLALDFCRSLLTFTTSLT